MKPHIVMWLGWWMCSDDQTHGFGKTPSEAWMQWFGWKQLGIYAKEKIK